jgi:hypothetical protein
MAYTFQDIVTLGRYPLSDPDKDRFADADLLEFARDAVRILRRKRPDLFFADFTATAYALASMALGSTFPLDDIYVPAVKDYITARAETKDDESLLEQRAQMFFSLFASEGGGG